MTSRTSASSGAEAAMHRRAALRIVRAQLGVTVVLAAALYGWGTLELAYAGLVGGAICTASSAYLAIRVFSSGPDADPKRTLRAFYAGEVVKIGLTVALFAIAIVALDLNVLVMFLAYLAATAVYWFALIADLGRQR